jgi:uncharacterized protein (DUF2267 family)
MRRVKGKVAIVTGVALGIGRATFRRRLRPLRDSKNQNRNGKIMKSHPPGVFETTLQKTNLWLKQISDLLHWNDHQKAYHGLRAVLHAFRDRLPVAEAAHLGAQLPILIRGFYYEDWKPASIPVKFKTAQEFYNAVKENFSADQNVNPIRLTQAVLQVLARNLSPGELEKLRAIFPPHLREIWIVSEQAVDLSDYV